MIVTVTRRSFIGGVSAALGAHTLRAAKSRMTKSRVAVITDEAGRTQSDAVAFAKAHGLQWVELRTVPELRKEFAFLTEPELKRYAAELAANKIKVSLLKTSILKFPWGEDTPRFQRRKEDLTRAIAAAQILGTDKIRVFTGARLSDPAGAHPAILKVMEEFVPIAESARIRLLIENEPSQNIGTCAELRAILEPLPSKALGFNWDPQNAMSLKETAWPDGYRLLPKARMMNVQIKAEGLSGERAGTSREQINWRSLMEALQKDGYQGGISLATEIADGTFEKANEAIGDVLHIVGELS